MDKFRIRGKITTKSAMNSIFPKFVVNGSSYDVYHTLVEMSSLPDNTRVFEPTVIGLGIDKELMYVVTSEKTYLFSLSISSGDVVWGSEVITFQNNINF